MNARPNAIEIRLYRLFEQCRSFLEDPRARVLRWRVRDDERSMISAFVAIESGEHGELPYMFLRCAQPFEDAMYYADALAAGLLESYETARADFEAEGLELWKAPIPHPRSSPAERWVALCASFQQHHAALMEGVVAVLLPSGVRDTGAFAAWIADVARIAPPTVRLLVPDSVDHPWLAPLAPLEKSVVMPVHADLDMGDALVDLARNAADTDQPSGQFRLRFVDLANAAGSKDIFGAEKAAEAARAIVVRQGWHHLEVAVLCALAAAYSAVQRPSDVLARYREADAAACKARESDEQLGNTLRLKVQLAIGATLVGMGEHVSAATVYEGCTILAGNVGDQAMLLEAWRMASWCYEQSNALARSWECGLNALGVAEQLDEKVRQHTTLPYVGEGLMRLARRRDARQVQAIDQRMQALTGRADWRPAEQGATRT